MGGSAPCWGVGDGRVCTCWGGGWGRGFRLSRVCCAGRLSLDTGSQPWGTCCVCWLPGHPGWMRSRRTAARGSWRPAAGTATCPTFQDVEPLLGPQTPGVATELVLAGGMGVRVWWVKELGALSAHFPLELAEMTGHGLLEQEDLREEGQLARP